jgi:hypothetical protein
MENRNELATRVKAGPRRTVIGNETLSNDPSKTAKSLALRAMISEIGCAEIGIEKLTAHLPDVPAARGLLARAACWALSRRLAKVPAGVVVDADKFGDVFVVDMTFDWYSGGVSKEKIERKILEVYEAIIENGWLVETLDDLEFEKDVNAYDKASAEKRSEKGAWSEQGMGVFSFSFLFRIAGFFFFFFFFAFSNRIEAT